MGDTMQPRIQYVKSADSVQIAYTTVGKGPPLVFAANAWGDINLFQGGERSPAHHALMVAVRSSS
jgi:hypothetical protein